MYNLPLHSETEVSTLTNFITQHPFALVTGCDGSGKPVATQLPLLLEERDGHRFLVGHLMKNMDHHTAFQSNPNVLAVFTSPNAYVSGSWYSNPHTPSTWNYLSVHAHGAMRFVDAPELKRILKKTTLHFEGDNKHSPTTFDQLPTDLTDRLMQMIVAFEIEVSSLHGVFKLSQDRDVESYRNIIQKLRATDEAGRFIATEMEKRADQIFDSRYPNA